MPVVFMGIMAPFPYFDSDTVYRVLSYDICIPAMRQAMIEHAAGGTKQLLRSFLRLGPGRTFAQMPAAIEAGAFFGAKLVSVFADPASPGRRRHRGMVILFDGMSGSPMASADAEAVTHIRTAAASAAATDALARPDARVLAILGAGLQAGAHVRALCKVRRFTDVLLWGRTHGKAEALAERLRPDCSARIITAGSAQAAVRDADVVCTVTASPDPILKGAWVRPGSHVNLVGSSGPGPREADSALVTRARYFGDCRLHVLQHGAEFVQAREEGVIDDRHFLAEIGAVYSGTHEGRAHRDDITVYKSLGHAVQDLAALAAIYRRMQPSGR